MKNITIKINEAYKSIPSGFTWANVPQFAIITGINGAGKSQLLEILNQKDKNNVMVDCKYDIKNEDGDDYNFILPSPDISRLSIQGLLTYHNEREQRITNIEQWNGAIKSWHDRFDLIQLQLKNEEFDENETRRLTQECKDLYYNIKSYKQMINNTTIFAYEAELNNISMKVGKKLQDLTEIDIRKHANPYFNTFTEIEDFNHFIKQEHDEYKDKLAVLANKGYLSEIEKLGKEEKPYQTINRLFKKYGFSYFEMLDPFPELKERDGEIKFKGQLGEEIDYEALSSGEQMIVKFVILSLGRNISGTRINTLIFDEPDAHLHPTMSKMMIDILSEISNPKIAGGGDIRVIITTHSPSTVAFAPEGTLFVMEKDDDNNRTIKSTTKEDAIRILSEGIFTFEKVINQFMLVANSDKNNILFVEGKTDVNHLKKANEILGYNLDLEIIDMHDAVTLSKFISIMPSKLFNGKKLIALFDHDDEGLRSFQKITGKNVINPTIKQITAEQCEKKSYALTINNPEGLEKYCPVEFLYHFDFLKENDIIKKREYAEYTAIFAGTTPEESQKIIDEFKNESSLRPFKVNDDKKNMFSEIIKSEKNINLFENFKPTLDNIRNIIEFKEDDVK